MSIQSRAFSAPQLSPGNFVQPAPPGGGAISQQTSSSSSLNYISPSSSSIFHRNPPRDPFTLSAPPSTTISTLPGSGGLFLSPSVNSHTGFVPSRIGASKTEAPMMKPPKPPEKPLMPYMRYSRRMWEKVRTSNPDSKLWDIGKIIGQMWRELPESSRQVYVDEYEAEKQEYDRALKAYHNSPSYQAYLVSKNRGGRGQEKSSGGTSEGGVYIQPVDEDEADAGQFSIKQLAASRFHRNHRLMKEIFGETQVPDARNVITTQRLGVLKKQVNSLTLHQNKLEEELKQLEAKFESKKRKMDESSSQFATTLKKICSQKIDPFEELVERSKTYLLNAYDQYKLQEQKQREALLNESSKPQETHPTSDQQPPSSSTTTEEANQNLGNNVDQNQPNQEMPVMTPGDLAAKSDIQNGTHQADTAAACQPSESMDECTAKKQDAEKVPESAGDGTTEAEQASLDSMEQEDDEDSDATADKDEKGDLKEEGAKSDPSNETPVDDSSENSQEA